MEKLDSRDSENPLSLCTEQGGPHSGREAPGHPKPEWRLKTRVHFKHIYIDRFVGQCILGIRALEEIDFGLDTNQFHELKRIARIVNFIVSELKT